MAQTLAFSWLLVAWYRKPHRAWGLVMYGLTGIVVLLSVAGVIAARGWAAY